MARRDEIYLLYTFKSPHAAIKAQKLLAEFQPKMIPVLREISASCGMALKLPLEHQNASLIIMEASTISPWVLRKINIEHGELTMELLKENQNQNTNK